MKQTIPGGVWPTMFTPFTDGGEIDYPSLEKAVEWYISRGVDGLFAVCQSSEMFFLTLEERVELAKSIVKMVNGRVPVIASGHISERFEDQVAELNRMAETGIDALVLIANRLAAEHESDEVLQHNLERLLNHLPGQIELGLYECPYPYKRLISPDLLRWCADTGRFSFLKDTCCDLDNIKAKIGAVEGSRLKVFNANTSTLLESLRLGAAGYSGVMANFHPELYVWLDRNWRTQPDRAEDLADILTMASFIEKQGYPANAKYYLVLEGVYGGTRSRWKDGELTATHRLEVERLRRLTTRLNREFGA
jgi:4-hydroxy-tetrahydrodipicolinate synthase